MRRPSKEIFSTKSVKLCRKCKKELVILPEIELGVCEECDMQEYWNCVTSDMKP